jgi:hypothetical protein
MRALPRLIDFQARATDHRAGADPPLAPLWGRGPCGSLQTPTNAVNSGPREAG